MKRNRFTPTTGILIIVLLGALFMVSKVVTPPPPGPPPTPEERAAAVKADPEKGAQPKMSAKEMKDRIAKEEDMAKRDKLKKELTLQENHGKPLPPEDGISSQYFRDVPMGAGGLKKADEDAANAKRVNEAVERKLKQMAPDSGVPTAPAAGSGSSAPLKPTPAPPLNN